MNDLRDQITLLRERRANHQNDVRKLTAEIRELERQLQQNEPAKPPDQPAAPRPPVGYGHGV